MINIDSFILNTNLTNFDVKERFGNFLSRPIKWIGQIDQYETLRKVFAIAVTVLLCCTIISLFIVIPRINEWIQQRFNKDPKIPSNIKKNENKISDNTITTINPIYASLTKFDNLAVKGQINGIYITTNEKNLTATDEFLKAQPQRDCTIHIGCATWYNFDIMCKRKSDYGLIVDFNPKNAEFIKKNHRNR